MLKVEPATEQEIQEFKEAAAARYKELGVPAKIAQSLFDLEMQKIGMNLGIAPKEEKQAEKPVEKKADPARIDKIASALATQLKVERKTAKK